MFIKDIAHTPHYTGTSLTFDTLDQVADAIRQLGELLKQDNQRVEDLIRLMRSSIAENLAYSAFADALTRGGRRGPTTGPAILLNHGYVANGRFFVHNDQGLTRWDPFDNQMIRVNEISPPDGEDGPVRYKLTVTDLQGSGFGERGRESSNHSESLLAIALGQERPLRSIEVQADYDQIGPNVDFDLEPLLRAIQGVDGIQPDAIDAIELAHRYYDIMSIDGVVGEALYNRRPVFRHASGATIWLAGVYGIQKRSDRLSSMQFLPDGSSILGRRSLVKLDGSVISGPPDKYYPTPHATFYVKPGDGMSNTDLAALVEALTNSLWANNYSLTV